MINKEEARLLALEQISKNWDVNGGHPVLLDEATIERNFGWVFFYDSSKHIETGELRDAIAGNAPIIVNKYDGSIHVTGTHKSVFDFIDAYERTGNPHA
ncbi:MAG: YrhB domain-containing protein [Leptolyngbyaceae cyanobacterium bins.302]|nr:YrhB domain-containing protein [Leptolyngbyaceae cyanobacterium bins.302]